MRQTDAWIDSGEQRRREARRRERPIRRSGRPVADFASVWRFSVRAEKKKKKKTERRRVPCEGFTHVFNSVGAVRLT